MGYELGITPDTLFVYLYRDADFDSVLTRTDEAGNEVDWVEQVHLLFPVAEVQWVATLSGASATFAIDKALTNLRENNELVELWVGEQCWAKGKVKRKGALE